MEKEQKLTLVGLEQSKERFANQGEEERKVQELSDKINDLVDQLVDARERLGLSQRDFAELVDLKQPAIARFERLDVIPRLDTFLMVAQALNANVYLEFFTDVVTKEMKATPYSTKHNSGDYYYNNSACFINGDIEGSQA